LNSRELTPRMQAKRDLIRNAARRLFLKQGFANTSTDAITAEAGVSKQTLYAYYSSKEELLADVLRSMVADLPLLGENPAGSEDYPISKAEGVARLQAQLVGIAQSILQIMMQADYLALVRVIIAEAPRFPYLSDLFLTTVPQQGFKAISAVLEQAKNRGLIEVGDIEAAARLFVGPLLTYALLDGLFKVDAPPQMPEPARVTALIELYMKALAGKD
jgi:TetR/AcrR family transcriptional repressor of mexJK operon